MDTPGGYTLHAHVPSLLSFLVSHGKCRWSTEPTRALNEATFTHE